MGEGQPLLALAFKVSLLDERRRHVFLRVYSGRVAEGDAVWNASQEKFEKVGRVLLMHAAQKERVPALGAGQIFAVAGLKDTRTGDTLTDKGHPLLLERLSSYEPVISRGHRGRLPEGPGGAPGGALPHRRRGSDLPLRRGPRHRTIAHLRHGGAASRHRGRAAPPRVPPLGADRRPPGAAPRDPHRRGHLRVHLRADPGGRSAVRTGGGAGGAPAAGRRLPVRPPSRGERPSLHARRGATDDGGRGPRGRRVRRPGGPPAPGRGGDRHLGHLAGGRLQALHLQDSPAPTPFAPPPLAPDR